jgi:hypothetical protein
MQSVTRVNFNCCFSVLVILLSATGCQQPSAVEKITELRSYSSGSGIAYFRNQIYMMGDDMSYVLVADTSFQSVDTIELLKSPGPRIPKDIKQDIEAVALLRIKKSPSLLLLGSGSAEPHRTKGWVINVINKERHVLELAPFYKRLLSGGKIKETNIEGVTAIPGGLILANRGNKSFPKNYLVFTSHDFWENQATADVRVIKLGTNTDTASFSGVSGLEYSSRSDCLLLTVSTENTYSTKADGTIGKSYLWLINNISAKKRMTAINPDRVIDLEELDDRFKGHKIESVCIVSENKSEYHLVLVADDDKGTSLLFKLCLKKKKK